MATITVSDAQALIAQLTAGVQSAQAAGQAQFDLGNVEESTYQAFLAAAKAAANKDS